MKKTGNADQYHRGACVRSTDLISALGDRSIGTYVADVYEGERVFFFYDWSNTELTYINLIRVPTCLELLHWAFRPFDRRSTFYKDSFRNYI